MTPITPHLWSNPKSTFVSTVPAFWYIWIHWKLLPPLSCRCPGWVNSFLFEFNMLFKLIIPFCFVITLVRAILNCFMFGLNMMFKLIFPLWLIITFVTVITISFMFWFNMFFEIVKIKYEIFNSNKSNENIQNKKNGERTLYIMMLISIKILK